MTEPEISQEVRALFAEDARAFLARMEAAAAILTETQALSPKSFLQLKSAKPFDSIEDAAQSIRGSASSVDADFLADSAAAVEELSRRGAQALELAAAHAQRAHALASFCNDAMREMGAMLKLYVEEAPDEASWLAMVVRERGDELKKADDDELARLEGGPGPVNEAGANNAPTNRPAPPVGKHLATPPPAAPAEAVETDTTFMPVEEFAFDDGAQPPPIARVFQAEAREIMLALKGYVETFLKTSQLSALDPIEPLLHTLKGSAASVELPYLSAQAADALELATTMRRSKVTVLLPDFLKAVNHILVTVAIPVVEDDGGARPSTPPVEVAAVFASEAERVVESARTIAAELGASTLSKDEAKRLVSDAAKLFHRLKGTALVVGAAMIADEAAAVMVACENVGEASVLAVAIHEGCDRIQAQIPKTSATFVAEEPVIPAARPRRLSFRPSEPPNFVSDGLIKIFRDEISGLIDPLNQALERLESAPHDPTALESLQRIFHTFKGTAAAVDQMAMSADAAELEKMLDAALEDPSKLDMAFVEVVREGAKRVLGPLGLAEGIVEALEELSGGDLESVDDPSSPGAPETAAAASPPNQAGESNVAPDEWDDVVANAATSLAEAEAAKGTSELDELAEIFAEEAEQLGPVITAAFEVLLKNPGDAQATRSLERHFHTLKGSAATVGRADLSAVAEHLRNALEAVGSGGVALTSARVLALKDASERLLAVATSPAPRDEANEAVQASDAFAFDEAQGEVDAGGNEELLQIFQQEAREALIALQGHVETLLTTPSSVYAAEYIERLFHTLKGAAATVGLNEIAARAADLQASMEEVLANKQTPDATFIEALVSKTNDLLRAIGVAPLVFPKKGSLASASASFGDSVDDVERRVFTGEVKAICRQASAKVRELLDATDADAGGRKRAEIADLLHRLKGTAATIGAQPIADEASRAMEMARGKAPAREIADVVRAAIVKIADLAGFERATRPRDRDRDGGGIERESVTTPEEPELWESFQQECTELLDALEKAVLSLEEVAQPKQVVSEIFRHVHTLKGAVNTVGLTPTGKVLHTTEDFLDDLQKAPIMPPMRTVASILIDVCKQVRQNLGTARSGWVETSLGSFAARTASAMRPGSSTTRSDFPEAGGRGATGSLRSLFDSAALFGTAAIRGDGSANGSRPDKSEHGSGSEAVSADERAYIRVSTTRLDALMNLAGELVVSRSRMANRVGTLRLLYSELGRSRVRLSDTVETFRDQYEFANIDGRGRGAPTRAQSERSEPLMPAPVAAKANEILRAVRPGAPEIFGELELDEYGDIHVLSRSLAEIGNDFEEAFRTLSSELSSFAEDADSLGGIISGIQGEVTRARMVPLDAVFTRLRIPVRDAATRDVKDVHVVTEGADVNIDKTIADAILQPMLHLVRNCVAHGIESPARRAALGKDRFGTIRLVARQQSGQIEIEVADDGAGLDVAALRARGIAEGLITADVTVDDPRVKELVFAAGLSTREVAGDVAGRGVGGEVVKRTIERLNGAIRIETTRGKGTSFIITLPLTLAITRALLVSEGQATYAVPLYFAERILDADSLDLAQTGNERRVMVDGTFSRLRRLDEYFGDTGRGKRGGPALILRVGDERMVLQVDAVLGQEEIVVKRAGELLEGHPLFAGVTLRGTGDLVLIVDVPGLLGEFGRVRPTDDVAGPTVDAPGARAQRPAPKARPSRSLPQAKAPAKRAEQAAKGAAPRGATHPLAGVRALVVDDSLSVRKVAESHLRGLGVEVTVAVDGVDGLTKLREGRFDIVFTDLEMPRMHGYDFIRQLRMLAAYQELPVVVVSSRSGQKHQDHARSVGATDYITKPFSAQSLESTIRRWLRS